MAVRVTFHHGRKKVRVTFKRKVATAASKAAKRRRGAKLARKYKLVWKNGRVWLKVGGKLRKIKQPHR
jgi:hypothetical protein